MVFKEKEISGWGNFPRVRSKIFKPSNVEEVKQVLQYRNNIARGLGRSYGDQSINESWYTTDFSELNRLISFDHSTGILECEAGVSLADIIHTFAPKGWFPKITPGTKFVTIGGAIANDIHGKAHHVDGTFANCVLEFTVLLANGAIIKASREENSDLFWANFGGLGLLGFILSAKIQLKKIETSYFIKKAVKAKNIEEMLEAFDLYDQHYNYSVAWIDPMAKGKNLGRGVLSLGNPALLNDLPEKLRSNPCKVASQAKLSLPFYFPNFALNKFSVAVLNQILDFVQSRNTPIVHYEQFFYPLDAVHHWNRGYGNRGFIQYQFVIPLENGSYNITRILTEIAKSKCVPFLNVLKKFGTSQQGILSFPMEGYTFAIDFPVTPHLPQLTGALDQMILEMKGRIYLGKDALLNENVFKAMYPHYKEWLKVKEKYDPDNYFTSNIARRLGLEVAIDRKAVTY